MQQLFPTAGSLSLERVYGDLAVSSPGDRPFVYVGMVSSVDGAATVAGKSGPLGGEADHHAFRRLREWADVVVVGARTVRDEDYGPVRLPEGGLERRRSRGQTPRPPIAVVTRSLDLAPSARLFTSGEDIPRPLVLTTEDADPARRATLSDVSDVVAVGRGHVALAQALELLHSRGYGRILVEGGPTLNGQLFAQGLVDELFLTLSPSLVGGGSPRIIEAAALPEVPQRLGLLSVLHHDGELLLRYRAR